MLELNFEANLTSTRSEMEGNRESRLWLAAIVLIAVTTRAHGYIDPGSGSFALQFLIAGALGLIYTVRSRFGQLRSVLMKKHVGSQQDVGPGSRG